MIPQVCKAPPTSPHKLYKIENSSELVVFGKGPEICESKSIVLFTMRIYRPAMFELILDLLVRQLLMWRRSS